MAEFVKIVVFVPSTHAEKIREVLGHAGAGHVGKYDFCSFSVKGVGRFRPQKGAKPFIGKDAPQGANRASGEEGKVEQVAEERIETICHRSKLKKVLAAVKGAHPYEEPAIDVYALLEVL